VSARCALVLLCSMAQSCQVISSQRSILMSLRALFAVSALAASTTWIVALQSASKSHSSPNVVNGVVRAESFEVMDSNGKVRARLGIEPSSGGTGKHAAVSLSLFPPESTAPRVEVIVTEFNEAVIRVVGESDGAIIELVCDKGGGGGMTVRRLEGKPSVFVGLTDSAGATMQCVGNSNANVLVSAAGNAARVTVTGEALGAIDIGAAKGSAGIHLMRQSGVVAAGLVVGGNEGGVLRLRDSGDEWRQLAAGE
jgi:hypothetical protein